jgi:hypothetical protein
MRWKKVHPRARAIRRAQASLAWTAFFFLAGQVAIGVLVNRVYPEARDAEFGTLIGGLRTRLAQPDHGPLVLVLGSSRACNAVRPAAIPADAWPGEEPLFYNFGQLKAGPIRQWQALHRLRAEGIRPALVLAEVWSPFLTHRDDYDDRCELQTRDLQLADWPLLPRYLDKTGPSRRKLVEGALVPVHAHRGGLLTCFVPCLALETVADGTWCDVKPRTAEPGGWLPAPPAPAGQMWSETVARAYVMAPILSNYQVSEVADRALNDLLRDCSAEGTPVALLMYPEHTVWRRCYSPQTEARIQKYIGGLAERFAVPIVDSRTWMADEDFSDAIHLRPAAAAPFTQRLVREVIRPLLEGQMPAGLQREDSQGRPTYVPLLAP